MSAESEAGPLWNEMTALYGEPGVADACLAAQDADGADVLLLLAAAVQARRGVSLAAATAAQEPAVERWRSEVVLPLRALRRRWRGLPGVEALRERLKVLELAAERSQFELMAPRLAGAPAEPRPALLRTNLAAVAPDLPAARRESLAAALGRGWRPAPDG